MAGETTPNPISDDEPLTRYITDADNLKGGDTPYVYWRAFRPRPADADLSIARVYDIPEVEIWDLGDALAGRPSGRMVVGRADFVRPAVETVRANGARLGVVPAEPPVRHAAIVGWPNDINARKRLAMAVAAVSTAVVR